MITFEELKERTTPEIIKKMVELAEGFELSYFDGHGDIVIFPYNKAIPLSVIYDDGIVFSTILHRTFVGFNKINEPTGNYGLYIDMEKIIYCNFKLPRNEDKIYDFKDYLPCHLTACEMAIWDCLLEVLK